MPRSGPRPARVPSLRDTLRVRSDRYRESEIGRCLPTVLVCINLITITAWESATPKREVIIQPHLVRLPHDCSEISVL